MHRCTRCSYGSLLGEVGCGAGREGLGQHIRCLRAKSGELLGGVHHSMGRLVLQVLHISYCTLHYVLSTMYCILRRMGHGMVHGKACFGHRLMRCPCGILYRMARLVHSA